MHVYVAFVYVLYEGLEIFGASDEEAIFDQFAGERDVFSCFQFVSSQHDEFDASFPQGEDSFGYKVLQSVLDASGSDQIEFAFYVLFFEPADILVFGVGLIGKPERSQSSFGHFIGLMLDIS